MGLYEIGMELAKDNKIPDGKVLQLLNYVKSNNVHSTAQLILEMYVNLNKSMPSELADFMVDSLAKNSIDCKIYSFAMGIINANAI